MLDEFRTALREEIFAAQKTSSSNAVPLTNGRKISQVGGTFQYAFTVDSILNVPGDAPGDLIVAGQRLPVVIVSTEGLTITLSVGIDLGEFVANARLQTDLTFLLRKLIERIEALNSKENPAGDRILGFSTTSGSPESTSVVDLNAEQSAAVASSLGRDTTFIWGPPGTGKTKTIGAIGAELATRGRSLLLVSHTNTAVDGALLQIAERLGEQATSGAVLRVGVPKESKLKEYPDLLLSTHVEKRSAGLTARISILEKERREKTQLRMAVQRLISISEWLQVGLNEIEKTTSELSSVRSLEEQANASRLEFEGLRREEDRWNTIQDAATRAKQATAEAAQLRDSLETLKERMTQFADAVASCENELGTAKQTLTYSESLEPFRERRETLPPLAEQSALARYAHEAAAQKQTAVERLRGQLSKAEQVYRKASAAAPLTRLLKGLPKPEIQLQIVERTRAQLTLREAAANSLVQSAQEAASTLREIQELEDRVSPYSDIPRLNEQRSVVALVEAKLQELKAEQKRLDGVVSRSGAKLQCLLLELEAFENTYHALPDEMLSRCLGYNEALQRAKEETKRGEQIASEKRGTLEAALRRSITALRELNLLERTGAALVSETAEEMISGLQEARQKGEAEVGNQTLDALRQDRDQLNERLRHIAAEIEQINEQLKRVEEVVISEATVIATTLTQAYLRDTIQKRRFDTVVLDEASMAPIPALYVATSLADRSALAVGDFKQLPPIVQSNNDLAVRWLGRDVFEVAGITKAYEQRSTPPYFVALEEQHRMHADISVIANDFFYDRILRNAESVRDDSELNGWYRRDWGHDHSVLLVDTGSIGAWVTSVARGMRSSRLNFLSATICVDLAERLIGDKVTPANKARILIISPYSPHAKLLKLLIKTQNLEGQVEAGTVHSFQGSEAPVVIIDLVNDEPHWRVGLFNPSRNEENQRLLNVAVTRARRRLFVVGDFTYCERLSKNAFLGQKLLPFLRQRYKTVSALDIVPTGLSARAASAQAAVFGGEIEADAARLVFTQDNYYPMLFHDIARAGKRVVIYSPFITANRLTTLEPQIKAAIDRGVRVYVITKPRIERSRRDLAEYQNFERALTEWNVVVIHKIRMHEKLVFVDDEVLWSSSLNPLSHSDTQEIVERRHSRAVVNDYAAALRLEDLVGAYDTGANKCPVCGGEMMPAEGADDPFYWSCEQGCFTHSIDSPPARDGTLTCQNCGGQVEFGDWGAKPAWRCVMNRHHHQRIHRNHLRLPRMRALIPQRELRRLEKQFGLSQAVTVSEQQPSLL